MCTVLLRIFITLAQSGRATQRYNSLLRRHASLSRKGILPGPISSASRPTNFSETKSLRSLRSLTKVKNHLLDHEFSSVKNWDCLIYL